MSTPVLDCDNYSQSVGDGSPFAFFWDFNNEFFPLPL